MDQSDAVEDTLRLYCEEEQENWLGEAATPT